MSEAANPPGAVDFVRQIVAADCANGKWGGRVATRFPPEPNGYLHIGHAKSICLNFGIAAEFNGVCRLRYDDTNPSKEDQEYVDSIANDVAWLGWKWEGEPRYASDCFEQMYQWAVQLISAGKAYVDDQTQEQIRSTRGTIKEPGTPSPWRERSVAENLDLFARMRAGEFPDGSKTLRAKIDMASPNFLLRDPIMYRIIHASHHRTGDRWCIYPMYDWAHGLEDSLEQVTHSICTLEFETHRPLYDWFITQLGIHHSQQIEFARLNLTWTVMSKRKLLELVQSKVVRGWDDPRMPTICGLRRRGVPAAALRNFCATIGVSKRDSTTEWALLEHHIRQELNTSSPRVLAVLDPLKVVVENWGADEERLCEGLINPEDPSAGKIQVPFTRDIWIERGDFMEDPPKDFYRLGPGREVRLRYVGFLKCEGFTKDASGKVTELRCSIDRATLDGTSPRKVKATIHWISAVHCRDAEVRLYDHLFTKEDPTDVPEGQDWKSLLNHQSLTVLDHCKIPPAIASAAHLERFQFERLGYFCVDPDSNDTKPVFNRTATLKDPWAKAQKKG
jgi:glutaminyl-tRNA synthetase